MRYEIRDIRMPARVQEAMQMQVFYTDLYRYGISHQNVHGWIHFSNIHQHFQQISMGFKK
jgi:hypothetical protein